ncbi:enoyl-CoA hydratase/isomerase family protein [Bradyrhizobium brasilense]|nr:enoyl-CoA hydratase/isomerase family protein [Bradyrhizobium brasilense]
MLTISRPQAGNSIDTPTALQLDQTLRRHRRNRALRAVIVTGAGGKFFCTGGDLKAYRSLKTKAQLSSAFGRVRKLLTAFESFPLPVIAAIDGYALGGGLELALACDLRFASSEAKLGFPQSRLGLIPGWNGAQRLVELVGRSRAVKLLFAGETIGAADALRLGLIDELSDGRSAEQQALDFVKRLEPVAPLSLGATKSVALAATRLDSRAAERAATKAFEQLWFTRDHREAEAAFVEKRTPRFTGK